MVCMFVSKQAFAKTTKQINTKLGERTLYGSGKNPFNFGVDLNLLSESFFKFSCVQIGSGTMFEIIYSI